LFILRFIIEWLFVLNESRSLNKNPEENKHHIAIARVVKRVKIVDIIKFLLMILVIALVVALADTTTTDPEAVTAGQKVLPAICLCVLISIPIAGKIFAKKQFKKIDDDIAAAAAKRDEKYRINLPAATELMFENEIEL